MASELKWTLCDREGNELSGYQFESFERARGFLSGRGWRVIDRDTASKVLYYDNGERDEED